MKRIDKIIKKIKNLQISTERENMKNQGVFDGRYKTRSIPSKKLYTRKSKHSNKLFR